MNIEIEKGIPIPPKQTKIHFSLPLEKLKVGDSFFHHRSAKRINTIIWARQRRGFHEGKVFRVRTELKDGVKGCRVWRVQ